MKMIKFLSYGFICVLILVCQALIIIVSSSIGEHGSTGMASGMTFWLGVFACEGWRGLGKRFKIEEEKQK